MIAALLLSLAAAAAPSPRLLVMDPQTGDDSAFAAADVLALQRLLIAELGRAEGVVVVAASDVAQLAELGSKQQLAGCELLVISELAQLGSRSIWQLALFDQKQGAILSRATIKADDIDGLADSLENAIAELLEPLATKRPPPSPSTATAAASSSPAPWSLAPAPWSASWALSASSAAPSSLATPPTAPSCDAPLWAWWAWAPQCSWNSEEKQGVEDEGPASWEVKAFPL